MCSLDVMRIYLTITIDNISCIDNNYCIDTFCEYKCQTIHHESCSLVIIDTIKMKTIGRVLSCAALLFLFGDCGTAQSPCFDTCHAVDKVYEATCATYPRATNEICHGTRTAWINRCGVQCAAEAGTVADPARAACQINCNTVVNQIFVTYCEAYSSTDAKLVCLDIMKAYAETCKNQCTLL